MTSKFKPITFPRDHQAHEAVIEWWYFNGHLYDQEGAYYSFMSCFFKADAKKINLPILKNIPFKEKIGVLPYVYFAHSLVSDIAGRKTYKEIQNISLVSRDSKPPKFFI